VTAALPIETVCRHRARDVGKSALKSRTDGRAGSGATPPLFRTGKPTRCREMQRHVASDPAVIEPRTCRSRTYRQSVGQVRPVPRLDRVRWSWNYSVHSMPRARGRPETYSSTTS
jgi:hypothetical protein